MKREIIFRGIMSHDTPKWIYGSLLIEDNRPARIVEKNGDWAYVNPDTIGQYAGRSDKNGTRIFEGDIVRYDKHETLTYKVDFDICGYLNPHTDDASDFLPGDDLLYECPRYFEVVGNIHDNSQD